MSICYEIAHWWIVLHWKKVITKQSQKLLLKAGKVILFPFPLQWGDICVAGRPRDSPPRKPHWSRQNHSAFPLKVTEFALLSESVWQYQVTINRTLPYTEQVLANCFEGSNSFVYAKSPSLFLQRVPKPLRVLLTSFLIWRINTLRLNKTSR